MHPQPAFEKLETRTLFAATAVLDNHRTLTITGTDAADAVSLSQNAAGEADGLLVNVNGSVTAYRSTDVRRVVIRTGAADDFVAFFDSDPVSPLARRITADIDSGAGDDTVALGGRPRGNRLTTGTGSDLVVARFAGAFPTAPSDALLQIRPNGSIVLRGTPAADDLRLSSVGSTGPTLLRTEAFANGRRYLFIPATNATVRIVAGSGNDSVDLANTAPPAGSGFVYFAAGLRSTLLGGAGNDTLRAGSAAARLDGGAGNDTLYDGNADDVLLGSAGNDALYRLHAGTDLLHGGPGDDTLLAPADLPRKSVEHYSLAWRVDASLSSAQS